MMGPSAGAFYYLKKKTNYSVVRCYIMMRAIAIAPTLNWMHMHVVLDTGRSESNRNDQMPQDRAHKQQMKNKSQYRLCEYNIRQHQIKRDTL